MRAVQRGLGLFGAVAALLVGMVSTPAAAAPPQDAAPLQEMACGIFPAPDTHGLQVIPVYDPDTGNLVRVMAAWVGSLQCVDPVVPNAVMETDFESQLWWEDVVPVGLDQTECSLVDGDTNCDLITTGGTYICDETEGDGPCYGKYHASFIVHVVFAPGVVWRNLPDICDQVQPAPLQVVDCITRSNTVLVDPFE